MTVDGLSVGVAVLGFVLLGLGGCSSGEEESETPGPKPGERCSVPGGSGTIVGGKCQVSFCFRGFANCDQDSANGCEAMLNSPQHCGSCQNSCHLPHSRFPMCHGVAPPDVAGGGAGCSFSCEAGYFDADGRPHNGCESTQPCPETIIPGDVCHDYNVLACKTAAGCFTCTDATAAFDLPQWVRFDCSEFEPADCPPVTYTNRTCSQPGQRCAYRSPGGACWGVTDCSGYFIPVRCAADTPACEEGVAAGAACTEGMCKNAADECLICANATWKLSCN